MKGINEKENEEESAHIERNERRVTLEASQRNIAAREQANIDSSTIAKTGAATAATAAATQH